MSLQEIAAYCSIIGFVLVLIGYFTGFFKRVYRRFRISKNSDIDRKEPRLKILDFEKEQDLRDWHFRDTGCFRRAITLDVQNEGGLTAERCVATMRIVGKPQTVTRLERKYNLHWADVPYSMRTTEAEPVDIEGGTERRLDIVFTDRDTGRGGCWIAIPMALMAPQGTRQAYLPPGEYKAKIEVSCANGTGDSKKLRITSPPHWRALDGEQTENE